MKDTNEELCRLADTAYRMLQEICQLRGELTEAQQRAAQATDAFRRELVMQRQMQDLVRKNAAFQRQFPSSRWVALAELNAIIDELPKRPVSRQAIHKWLVGPKSTVRARMQSGRWLVDLESFRANWQLRGFPELPWQRLRRVDPRIVDDAAARAGPSEYFQQLTNGSQQIGHRRKIGLALS